MTEERLPIPLEPMSSDEYAPLPLSPVVAEARKRAWERASENARRLAMPRRDFLRTAMGAATVLMTLNACNRDSAKSEGRSPGGSFDVPKDADLDEDSAKSVLDSDLPVLDAQTHFLEYDLAAPPGPGGAFFGDGFPHQNCGEKDHRACFSIDNYIKSMFTQSETALCVISAVAAPDPHSGELSVEFMDRARQRVKEAVGGDRILLHGLLAPSTRALSSVLEDLEAIAATYKVSGWKAYTNNGRGWRLDDGSRFGPQVGLASLQKILDLGVPRVCVHKGISGGDEWLSPADVGPAARQFPEVKFGVYHSGWEPGTVEGPYTDATAEVGTNRLVTTLRKAGVKPGKNVYSEIGSTWFNVMNSPDEASHVLGKMLKAVGEDNILWGTDSIWYGSPQFLIDGFRSFRISNEFQETFGYPELTPKIKGKILARNVAEFYDLDLSKIKQRPRPE
ncbi:MAG TPA: amidohydrolase family protein [Acidimicrobiales bacterium]|nr:amidohydrolase family protein [Acidimicrobiales bacterium]